MAYKMMTIAHYVIRRVRRGITHLSMFCAFGPKVWYQILTPIGFGRLLPGRGTVVVDWWLSRRMLLHYAPPKTFDVLVILTTWSIWKECNRDIFNGVAVLLASVVELAFEVQVHL